MPLTKPELTKLSEKLNNNIPIISATVINNVFIVIYDYMHFADNMPARNLFAYSEDFKEMWVGEIKLLSNTDAYTDIISEEPLVVGNFSGCNAEIDISNGRILSAVFTK